MDMTQYMAQDDLGRVQFCDAMLRELRRALVRASGICRKPVSLLSWLNDGGKYLLRATYTFPDDSTSFPYVARLERDLNTGGLVWSVYGGAFVATCDAKDFGTLSALIAYSGMPKDEYDGTTYLDCRVPLSERVG